MINKTHLQLLAAFLLLLLVVPLTGVGAVKEGEREEAAPHASTQVSGANADAGPAPFAATVLLNGELFASTDDQLLADSRVKEQMAYFTSTGRSNFQNWLDQSLLFFPVMRDIFRAHKLPENLVYIAMIESGFRFHAISRSHAVGPWQFMPETAKKYGLVMNEWIDERRDPVKSTVAAAVYLKYLFGRFNSWPLTLASYNAGAGKVRRALLQSSDKGLTGLYGSRTIRRETKNYVPKLAAAIILTKEPVQYGFVVKKRLPFRYDVVRVGRGMNLQVIAAAAGCTVEEIKSLNPELTKEMIPPYAHDYPLRVPRGTKKNYLASLRIHSVYHAYAGTRAETAYGRMNVRNAYEYALLRKRETFLSA